MTNSWQDTEPTTVPFNPKVKKINYFEKYINAEEYNNSFRLSNDELRRHITCITAIFIWLLGHEALYNRVRIPETDSTKEGNGSTEFMSFPRKWNRSQKALRKRML